ncbi:S8 family serine peptidase [Bradyrhizobium algeriense]|uniref:S8 family serine peptidase n=1 Tax=Bradyrhizobium algeriense TaxID=634784 RepID=UPI000D378FA3|nr:S8 family serine peptidase [Bradyrhizobium algeriense]
MAAKKARKSRSTSATKTRAGFVSTATADTDIPDYVVVELRYEAPVAFTATRFAAPAAAEPQAASLNEVLSKFDIKTMRSQFHLPADTIRSRVEVAAKLPSEPQPARFAKRGMDADFIQSGFVQVVPKSGAEAKKIVTALKRQKAVWDAYVAPRPVPAMPAGSAAGSRNFEPSQGYLYDAPNGIGAAAVWGLAGAKGSGITICDIEGNWNRQHEDLPSGIPLLGGTVIDDLGWRNHGTAVLGEMISIPDARGCVGISHQAKGAVHSAVINGVFNTAGAISNAAAQLKKGDVILIELQATGPNGNYVAMQYWSDIFAAIKAAVDKGITVVEAAGNGNENFDLAVFNNTGLQKDSGAIVVGAGVPPTNHVDFDGFGAGLPSYASLGVPRSRIFFSNYGKIVNVQGWGWHVTTLGYGDAQGGASENTWYTLRFSGTSSASPIVTGAVACLQGRARAKNGAPMTPKKVRNILMTTGTPQQGGPGVPLTQHIGPLPNLVEAMKKV